MTNVTSLLKTVKSVEDEHTRGTRALEATVEAIAQEIRVSGAHGPWRPLFRPSLRRYGLVGHTGPGGHCCGHRSGDTG